MKKLLILSLFVFILFGCEKKETLDTPTNIQFESETLQWDEVADATEYLLNLNGDLYTLYTPAFSTHNLESGEYEAIITATRDDLKSAPSEPFVFTLSRTFEHPKNLMIINDILSWDEIDDIDYYDVHIDDLSTQTSEASFDLTHLLEDSIYELKVKAIYPNGESSFSTTLYYHTYETPLETTKLSYNILRGGDLPFALASSIEIKQIRHGATLLPLSIIATQNDHSVILQAFLEDLTVGVHIFELYTSAGLIALEITLNDEEKPFIVSSSHIFYTPDQNMTFDFELFGGSFGGLTGNDIQANEYNFDNGTLTINASYVARILADNPTRSRIILGYNLTKDDHITIGYIMIDIEE